MHIIGSSHIHVLERCHMSDVTWASWHLKSPATRQLVQHLVQANMKGNIKGLHHWSFVRRIHLSSVDSPHKGPVMQKVLPCHDIRLLHFFVLVLWEAFNMNCIRILLLVSSSLQEMQDVKSFINDCLPANWATSAVSGCPSGDSRVIMGWVTPKQKSCETRFLKTKMILRCMIWSVTGWGIPL